MKGFVLTGEGIVLPEWIDRNRHMNVAAYMKLFDAGMERLLGTLGFSGDADTGFVAGRIYIEHRRELMEGESWQMWSGIVSVAPNTITVTNRIRSGSAVRAVCDIKGTPFCKLSRSALKMPDQMIERIASALVPGLLDRFDTAR